MTCEQFADNVDALALDALSPVETAEMQAHLALCTPCATRLNIARDVVNRLPAGVPVVKAPASLRVAVLAAVVSGEPGAGYMPAPHTAAPATFVGTAAPPAHPAAAPNSGVTGARGNIVRFRRRGRILAVIAATFAGLAIVGLSAWTANLQQQIHDLKRQQVAASFPVAPSLPGIASATNAQTAALVLISSPTTVRAPLGTVSTAGPSGAVFWNPDQQRCVVLARQLAAPSADYEYHVWFGVADKSWDGGRLAPDANGDAEAVVPTDRWEIERAYTVAIVLQPVNGDGTRQQVLSGEIRALTQ